MSVNSSPSTTAIYLRLLGAAAIWASTFSVGRYAAALADPLALALLRFSVAGAVLFAIAWRREPTLRLHATQWPLVLALSLTGVVGYTLFFLTSVQYISASRAAIIGAINPVVVAAISAKLGSTRLTVSRWAGIALALAGAVIVLVAEDPRRLSTALGPGELLALGGMATWSLHTLLSRRIGPAGLSSLLATTWSVALGAALLVVPALLVAPAARILEFPVVVWLSVSHMALLASALAFIWYADGIGRIGPTRAAIFTNLVPVFAVLIGVTALDEPFHWSMGLGCTLAIVGVWLANRTPRAPKPAIATLPTSYQVQSQ